MQFTSKQFALNESLQRSYDLENAWNEGFIDFVDDITKARYCAWTNSEKYLQWKAGWNRAKETFTR